MNESELDTVRSLALLEVIEIPAIADVGGACILHNDPVNSDILFAVSGTYTVCCNDEVHLDIGIGVHLIKLNWKPMLSHVLTGLAGDDAVFPHSDTTPLLLSRYIVLHVHVIILCSSEPTAFVVIQHMLVGHFVILQVDKITEAYDIANIDRLLDRKFDEAPLSKDVPKHVSDTFQPFTTIIEPLLGEVAKSINSEMLCHSYDSSYSTEICRRSKPDPHC